MDKIVKSVEQAVWERYGVRSGVDLVRPDERFGDFATNVALKLISQLPEQPAGGPRAVAEELAGVLRQDLAAEVSEVSVAGPGFINIRLTDQALIGQLSSTPLGSLKGKKVVVEYSDPNPFKPLHAGHLYTTLVGDIIARLVEQAGAETIRLNYGGDVGLHVGKSLWAIVEHLGGEKPDQLQAIPQSERPAWLGARYVEGNQAYTDGTDDQKAAITKYNQRAYQIQAQADHDSLLAQIYWTCRKWSYDYFQQLYDQLEVVPFDRFIPESEVTELGLATVRQQLENGVYQLSDGAVVFDGQAHGLHTRVFINSNGLPTYEAKDVGLSLTKWRDYQFDQSIIITDNEQQQYMEVVIKSIAQFAPEPAQRTRHLTHGMVRLKGGVKMSSRKGNIVGALDILESARAAGLETGNQPDEQTILAAIKYSFARNRLGGDIVYDPVESIALEGNSGPYLQYAHARACSIVRKSNKTAQAPAELLPAERSLVRKISQYQETVAKATEELSPHHICNYLYELAQSFNYFYEHNRVIDDQRESVRLWLVELYANTLKQGLALLGITAPDKM